MKIKKVLLCNLPLEGELHFFSTPPYFLKEAVSYPPLGLLYLAAQVKDTEVKILDTSCEKLTIEQTVQRIMQEKPDILGFTAYTMRVYSLKTICEKINKEFKDSIRIVIGGNHTLLYPIETLNYRGVNYVLKGECDYTFPQLLKAIRNGEQEKDLAYINGLCYFNKSGQIQCNRFTKSTFNLDALPFPRRNLLNLKLYSTLAQDATFMTTMISSRGCPFKCIFCDVPNEVVRFRSPENVVNEIKEVVNMGISEISFFDDCFNLDRTRVIEICRLIIKNKLNIKWSGRLRVYPFDEEMAELIITSGCNRLHFGVESTSDNILKYTRKGINFRQSKNTLDICRKYKIKTLAYLIFGFPQESLKDLKQSEKIILNELKPDLIFPNILFPLAGSPFYYELLKGKKLKDDFWARFVKNPTPNFEIPSFRIPKEDKMLIKFINNLNRKFYLSPQFIYNNLSKVIRRKNLLRSIKICVQMIFGAYQ